MSPEARNPGAKSGVTSWMGHLQFGSRSARSLPLLREHQDRALGVPGVAAFHHVVAFLAPLAPDLFQARAQHEDLETARAAHLRLFPRGVHGRPSSPRLAEHLPACDNSIPAAATWRRGISMAWLSRRTCGTCPPGTDRKSVV